jgi:hypothetical protein
MQITGHRKYVNKDTILQLAYKELTNPIIYAFCNVAYCISDIELLREEQHRKLRLENSHIGRRVICICIYVCMYVCMYVYVFVCMYE